MDSVELGGFLISKIIKWEDLKGLHGFATGNTKKPPSALGKWRWIEFQWFFIL